MAKNQGSDVVDLETIVVTLAGDGNDLAAEISDVVSSLESAAQEIGNRIKDIEAQQKQMLSEGIRLTQAFQEPQERFNNELARYKELLDANIISQQTYDMAAQAAYGRLPHIVEFQREYNAAKQEAAAITRQVQTAEEEFLETQTRLDDLLNQGLISWDTYNRAVQAAQESVPSYAQAQQHAQRVLASVRTEQEVYTEQVGELTDLLTAGLIPLDAYNAAVDSLTTGLSHVQEAQRRENEQIQRAQQIIDSTRTPLEKYNSSIDELDQLLRDGRIDQETYNRAAEDLVQTLPEVQEAQRYWNDLLTEGATLTRQMQSPLENYEQGINRVNRLLEEGAISAETHARSIRQIRNEYIEALRQGGPFSQMLREMSRELSSIGKGLSIAITAPVAGLFAGSMKEFTEFDKAMKSAQSIMGEFDEQTEAMVGGSARELSLQYNKAAADIVTGYQNLASAGMDVQQSLRALPTFLQLARAGEMSLDAATVQLMGSLNSLGMFSNDLDTLDANLKQVANAIATTANVATGDIGDFTAAVSNGAGAAAQAMGQSVDSMMAILAGYASKNTIGNVAGTQFSILTRELQKSIMTQKKVWERYGIEVVDEATGQYRDIVDIVYELGQELSQLEAPLQKAAMGEFGFAHQATKALLPILQSTEAIKQYKEQIAKGGDALQNMSDLIGSSFYEQIMSTWTLIKGIALDIGNVLAPYVAKLNEYIQAGLSVWNQLDENVKTAIVGVLAFAAAIGPVVLAIASVMSFVSMLGPQLAVIGAVLGTAASWAVGVGLVVAAIGGLVYWLVGPEGLSQAWSTAVEYARGFFSQVIGFFSNFTENWQKLITWLGDNWYNLFIDLGSAIGAFIGNGLHNFGVLVTTATRLFSAFTGFLSGLIQSVFTVDFVKWVWEGVKSALKAIWDFAGAAWEMVKSIWSGRKGTFDDYIKTIKSDFQNGAEDIVGTTKKILQDGLSDLRGPLQGFESTTTDFPDFTEPARKGVEETIDQVKELKKELEFEGLKAALDDPLEGATQKQRDFVAQLEQQIATFGKSTREVEIWKFAAEGATDAAIDKMQQLSDELKQLEANKAGEDFVNQLKEQLMTLDMSADAAEIWKLEQKGVEQSIIDQAKALQKEIASLKEYKKLTDDATALNKKHKAGNWVDQEKMQLQEMLDQGLIGIDVYQKELENLQKEAKKGVTAKAKLEGLDAIEAGSADFVAELLNMRRQADKEIIAPAKEKKVVAAQANRQQEVQAKVQNPEAGKQAAKNAEKEQKSYQVQMLEYIAALAGQNYVVAKAANL